MKRILLLSLALLILLCACKKDPPPVTTDAVTTDAPTVTTEPIATTSETFPITVVTPDIGDDSNISYEILTIGDAELQAILDAEAEAILAKYIPNISSISDLGGTAEYDVTLESMYKNEKILSAVFSGSYAIYYENSEEGGEVLYTVNIDRTTGEILSTSDIIDFDKMVEVFKSGRLDAYPDFSQYSSAYEIYPYVYLDEGCITICVTKSGMYEEVLRYGVSYNDAKDFLKIED